MNNMKRFVSVLLALCMVVSCFAGVGFVAYAESGSVVVAGVTLDESTPYLVKNNDVWGASANSSGAYAQFVSSTSTLKFLQNAEIQYKKAGDCAVVSASGDITIDTNGKTVELYGIHEWSYGIATVSAIKAGGGVVVCGGGTLNARTNSEGIMNAGGVDPLTSAIIRSDKKITFNNVTANVWACNERDESAFSSSYRHQNVLWAPSVEFGTGANVVLEKSQTPSINPSYGAYLIGGATAENITFADGIYGYTSKTLKNAWVIPAFDVKQAERYRFENLASATYMTVGSTEWIPDAGPEITVNGVHLNRLTPYLHIGEVVSSNTTCTASATAADASAVFEPGTMTLKFLKNTEISGAVYGETVLIESEADLILNLNGKTVTLYGSTYWVSTLARTNCVKAAGTLTLTGGGYLKAYINGGNVQDTLPLSSALYADAVVFDEIIADLYVANEKASTDASGSGQSSVICASEVQFGKNAVVKMAKAREPYGSKLIYGADEDGIVFADGVGAQTSDSLKSDWVGIPQENTSLVDYKYDNLATATYMTVAYGKGNGEIYVTSDGAVVKKTEALISGAEATLNYTYKNDSAPGQEIVAYAEYCNPQGSVLRTQVLGSGSVATGKKRQSFEFDFAVGDMTGVEKVRFFVADADNNMEVISEVLEIFPEINILIIGNSFSLDGTQYLNQIAAASHRTINVGVVQKGGSNIKNHWENRETAGYFSYEARGIGTSNTSTTLAYAFQQAEWDMVFMQQWTQNFNENYNTDASQWDAWQPYMNYMAQYILQNEPQAQLGIQFTWSYEKGFWPCDGANDAERWANQMKVYNNIYANTLRAAADVEAAVGKPVTIVPTGYVVQYARINYDRFNTTLDKTVYNDYTTEWQTYQVGHGIMNPVDSAAGRTRLNRDGYHLNNYGLFLAGCTWYEAITGKSILDNPYMPGAIKLYGQSYKTNTAANGDISFTSVNINMNFSPVPSADVELLRSIAHTAVAQWRTENNIVEKGLEVKVGDATLNAECPYLHLGATEGSVTACTANATASGAVAVFNPETKTLTFLKDAEISYVKSGEAYIIASDGDLAVDLNGKSVTLYGSEWWVTPVARANCIRAAKTLRIFGGGYLRAYVNGGNTCDKSPLTAPIFAGEKVTFENIVADLYVANERVTSDTAGNIQCSVICAPKVEFGADATVKMAKNKAPSGGYLIYGVDDASDIIFANGLYAYTSNTAKSDWNTLPEAYGNVVAYNYSNLAAATYMSVSPVELGAVIESIVLNGGGAINAESDNTVAVKLCSVKANAPQVCVIVAAYNGGKMTDYDIYSGSADAEKTFTVSGADDIKLYLWEADDMMPIRRTYNLKK